MNPRPGIYVALACAITMCALGAGALTGCTKSSSITPTPSPTPAGSNAPDTLYVQDASSKTVRVYKSGSTLNGVAIASAALPTSDGSNPDVVYSPKFDVLWFPSAYPLPTMGPPMSTPIKIWTAPSTKNNQTPFPQVPYSNGQGTATYDVNHDLLYVGNVTGPTIQVFSNAHLMTGASAPAANITLGITDGSVSGTPRAQELLYDPVNDRLFASDMGAVMASFDAFGAAAQAAVTAHTNPTIVASREVTGLNSPDGLAYSAATDVLFVSEINAKQINVIHNASTASGPNGHTQTITSFNTGPAGMAFDAVRDLLFVYDPLTVDVIPAPETQSGSFNSIVNRRQFIDATTTLSGFGIAVDVTH